MFRFWAAVFLAISCSLQTPVSGIQVLGVAQDGGRPQVGCKRVCCNMTPEHQDVASLAVVNGSKWVMIDATPDFAQQVMQVGHMPAAIVLTHAHIGHYTGLMQLGREVMGADHVPVWCSARMANFLRENAPWDQLVALGNIELHEFQDQIEFSPIDGIALLPHAVPHRDEYSDTFGFSIEVDGIKTLYIPDIDAWEPWGQLQSLALEHDAALLDATFFDDHELPGRDMSLIPHPRVAETMQLLGPLVHRKEVRVIFTHLNHTNPLWINDSEESNRTRRRGFEVAYRGMWITRDG